MSVVKKGLAASFLAATLAGCGSDVADIASVPR